MIEEKDEIFIDYLLVEIEKMQNTVEGLEKMIEDKDSKKEIDLIKILTDIRCTTLKNIDDKKRELQCLYNKKINNDNN